MRRLLLTASLLGAVSACTEPVSALLATPLPDASAPADAEVTEVGVYPDVGLPPDTGAPPDTGWTPDSGWSPDSGPDPNAPCVDLSVEPRRLDFGMVPAGNVVTRSFAICNPGPGTVRFSLDGFSDNGFSTVVLGDRPLGEGRVFHLHITFAPLQVGLVESLTALRIQGRAEPFPIVLAADVVDGVRGPWCEDLLLGAIAAGQCTPVFIDCYNHAPQPLHLRRVEASLGEQIVRIDQAQIPREWAPNAHVRVALELCPAQSGPFEATVELVDAQGVAVGGGQIVAEASTEMGCALAVPSLVEVHSFALDEPREPVEITNVGRGVCRNVRVLLDDPQGHFRLGAASSYDITRSSRARPLVVLVDGQVGVHEAQLVVEAPGNLPPVLHIPLRFEVGPRPSPVVTTRPGAGFAAPPRSTNLVFSTRPDGSEEAPVSFGFPVRFAGLDIDYIRVNSRGYLSTEPRREETTPLEVFPDPQGPRPAIVFWGDLLGPPPVRRRFTEGPMGSRVVRVQLAGLAQTNAPTGPQGAVELRFYEADGHIEVEYGALTPGTAPDRFHAAVGWQGPYAELGAHVLPCSPACTAADWPAGMVFEYRDPP